MRLINSKVEYIPQQAGLAGVYKNIEIAGRTAYQSLDKITGDSAKEFVDRMVKSKHFAALEHGTVYLDLPNSAGSFCAIESYATDKYSQIVIVDKQDRVHNYVTANYRILIENNWLNDLQYLCEHTEYHEKRYTFRFITDIGICRELLRHRKFSFLNESTRYCNYSKGKYGEEITYIIPLHLSKDELSSYGEYHVKDRAKTPESSFKSVLNNSELCYLELIKGGWKAEQARQVLPLATKTELIMTGFASDWRYLLNLRLFNKTGKSHPDMINLMEKLRFEALEAGIWHDIMKYPSKFK